ncbi:hypothetical protein ABZX51_004789 [Aspergillus tubingensis]
MASVTLESLPVELIEEIVAWLDFHAHCALRLTGRTISVKSSNATFRNYFLSKKLEIAEAPLEQFVGVTQPGRFGLWVQDLILYTSIALHTEEVPPVSPRVFELLVQGFANIHNNSPHDEPLSITLKVFGDGYLGALTDRVFQVTMSALKSSGLPLRSLDAFADGYSHTYGGRCSFPFGEIPAVFGGSTADLTRLAAAFQPCKKIGLSLAHHIHKIDFLRPRGSPSRPGDDFELPPSYEEARENTRSLAHLLNLCPTLEELHLVWEYDDFDETAGLTRLVRLDLKLIHVDGHFDGLFRLLSTAMPELNYLRLQYLYSSSGTIYFPHEPRDNFVRSPLSRSAQRLIRRGVDARRPVITKIR